MLQKRHRLDRPLLDHDRVFIGDIAHHAVVRRETPVNKCVRRKFIFVNGADFQFIATDQYRVNRFLELRLKTRSDQSVPASVSRCKAP